MSSTQAASKKIVPAAPELPLPVKESLPAQKAGVQENKSVLPAAKEEPLGGAQSINKKNLPAAPAQAQQLKKSPMDKAASLQVRKEGLPADKKKPVGKQAKNKKKKPLKVKNPGDTGNSEQNKSARPSAD